VNDYAFDAFNLNHFTAESKGFFLSLIHFILTEEIVSCRWLA
jgi:hypothetical protein